MTDESLEVLSQINEAISSIVANESEVSDTNEDIVGNLVNITPDGVHFQGYTVEQIKELENVTINILSNLTKKTEKRAGYVQD